MNPTPAAPHTIDIEIAPDGQITGTVKGVTGPACSDISKWLNSLGEVTEDQHTPDYYKTTQQTFQAGR